MPWNRASFKAGFFDTCPVLPQFISQGSSQQAPQCLCMQQEAGTRPWGQLPAGRCRVETRPASSRWHPGLTHVLSGSGLCKQHCRMQVNKSKGFSFPLAGWLTGPEEFPRSVGQVGGSVQSRQSRESIHT